MSTLTVLHGWVTFVSSICDIRCYITIIFCGDWGIFVKGRFEEASKRTVVTTYISVIGVHVVMCVASIQCMDSHSAGPEWLKTLYGFIPQK